MHPKDYFRKFLVTGSEKEVLIEFKYYFKKGVYDAQEYTLVKAYFNEIVKKSNERIVLSKKPYDNRHLTLTS